MKLIINKKTININLLNTETSNKISNLKGFRSKINTWGDEIYFKIPLNDVKLEENSIDVVKFGQIAYWTEGNSIAIGFGPTPASINDEIRLVSKVNIWANFDTSLNSVDFFKSIKNNDIVSFIN